MDAVYREAASARRAGQPATLVVVTKSVGHTPQVVGATMLVRALNLVGTVGGGRFEHEVIAAARKAVRPERLELALGADLGMCCGGVMEVLITPVTAADEWLDAVVQRLDRGETAWLSTDLDSGERVLTEAGALPAPSSDRRFEHAMVIDERLVERIQAPPRLVLFGAGHVAQPTAAIAHMLGYRVVVVDDRPDWNTEARFPDAERVLQPVDDYLFDFEPRPTDSLLIVTRGHELDQQVLEAVVEQDVAYLGMIGSTSKVHRAMKRLEAAGIDEARREHVHAPIGLQLGALTPEEIAVSIAAELVRERRT